MKVQIVAYATPRYAGEARALKATASELCLPLVVSDIRKEWTWHEAVSHKPTFLLEQLLLLEDDYDGLLYVDADARFRKVPDFSFLKGFDFGYHAFKRGKLHKVECLTGTLWLARKVKVAEFLRHWVKLTPRFEQSQTPEQDSLAATLVQGWGKELRIVNLPPELIWIADDFFHTYGPRSPVIEQTQASRRLRDAKDEKKG